MRSANEQLRNELLMHTTTGMQFRCVIVTETALSQKVIEYSIYMTVRKKNVETETRAVTARS